MRQPYVRNGGNRRFPRDAFVLIGRLLRRTIAVVTRATARESASSLTDANAAVAFAHPIAEIGRYGVSAA